MTAEQSESLPNGMWQLKEVKIQSFREAGVTNAEMTVAAPGCICDMNNRTASSPGPLQINSGDGNLHIDGEGFLWANAGLTISNNVHTTIKRGYLSQAAAPETPANAATPHSITNSPPGTNQIIEIRSDHFFYNRQTDTITYTGNVIAEDAQTRLFCDIMVIQRSTNGTIDNIVADRNVVIISKTSGGRATGKHAVYTAGQEHVELTGDPHWQDGQNEGTAKVFIFDRDRLRNANTLREVGDAYLKLPRNSIGQSGFMLTSPAATNAPGTETTTNFVEIYSDTMTFEMPPTNGPVQRVTADQNVLILDSEKNSRATGHRAVYTEATGLLELTGNAVWQAGGRLAKGGILIFDRNHQAFTARTNAYLRFPLAAFGGLAPQPASALRGEDTNRFVGIVSDHYDYQNQLLTCHDEVNVGLFEGEEIRGTLDCGTLIATFTRSNQLQQIEAETKVYARLLPAPNPRGALQTNELKCEHLKVFMRTNSSGLIETLIAEQEVLGIQTTVRTNSTKPVRQTLNTDILNVHFLPKTNEVERVVAERNVVLTRDTLKASGTNAVYTGTNGLGELTGSPVRVYTNDVLIGMAEAIAFDQRNNKLFPKSWTLKVNIGTNGFRRTNATKGAPTPNKAPTYDDTNGTIND